MASLTSSSCSTTITVSHLEFEETELRLGLPGSDEVASTKKRTSATMMMESSSDSNNDGDQNCSPPPPKAQVVGWPPVRSYRKNCFQQPKSDTSARVYVKVSMDGAPYLRKVDLKVYRNYQQLLKALETLFNCTIGVYSETEGYNNNGSSAALEPTYEDKDGDWMLVGDVPWEMFITSCKRLRIMRPSESS